MWWTSASICLFEFMSNMLDIWANLGKMEGIKWNCAKVNFSSKTVLDSNSEWIWKFTKNCASWIKFQIKYVIKVYWVYFHIKETGEAKEFHIMWYLNSCETVSEWILDPLFWLEKIVKYYRKIILGYSLYA